MATLMLTPDPEVERVARVLAKQQRPWLADPFGPYASDYLKYARAAIAAMKEGAALPRATPSREEVARVIDPRAFKSWQSFYEYCLRQGDSEEEAVNSADWAHGKERDEAFALADQILSLLPASRAGWRLVPEEATEEMLASVNWQGAVDDPDDLRSAWNAMLKAAPLPEPPSLAAAPEEG